MRSGRDGLDDAEARERLERHGPNSLPPPATRHPVARFLFQFHNALIYALLAAAGGAAALGHVLDAAIIVAVVLVNAVVAFIQEGRAENALAAIRRLVAPKAHVMRNGRRLAVPVPDLVPGDVVLLEAGDRVPADLRLLRARGLLLDEGLLTGESVAAQKQEAPAPHDAPIAERHSMAFSGTLVAAGQASAVVVATGADTELGRIGALLSSVDALTTPLLRQINRFGRRFAAFVAVGGVLLAGFAVYVQGWSWADALMAVVAVAVGVIPEGLPAVITVTLAIGVQRMARRNAVIRQLPAVETLGAVSVICSDKTGTLTRNEMLAARAVGPRFAIVAEGEGYGPHGRLRASDEHTDDAQALADVMDVLRCGALCNDAVVSERAGAWAVAGDPMEGALLALAVKAGLDAQSLRGEWQRVDEIPFDASYRYMASLHRGPAGEAVAFIKGAPERVLEMADAGDAAQRARWERALAHAASQGQRLLAFASRRLPAGHARLVAGDVEQGAEFLGLVSFIDPPRAEAKAAIAECKAAGIQVKMITGDHAATGAAIAAQLGIHPAPVTVSGAQLDQVPDAQLQALVERTHVFARTSPEHKLRIVRALQAAGRIVAMTGDGVNDAPSLKQADVGVAMGIKGTEASKEAAGMVLLDDNFASIVNAVHEGRTVYDNIRKVIAWTLPTNGGEVLGAVLAILLGFSLPMSAAQILWVNLATSSTLGLALAFEPSESGVMARAPRQPDAPLLSGFMLWRTALVSVLFTMTIFLIFFHVQSRGDGVDHARTLVVNAIMAMEVAYLFSVRYLHQRSFTFRGTRGTYAVWAALAVLAFAQVLFTYLPAMNAVFGTVPLGPADLGIAVAAGVALMLVLETEKAVTRWRGGKFARSPWAPREEVSVDSP